MSARSISIALRFVFLLAALTLRTSPFPVAAAGLALTLQTELPATQPPVTLQAASQATAAFMTQNGATVDGVLSEASDLPHLVLFRNGTLIVEVTGLQVPTAGVTVTLEIETQHRDPDFAGEA